jgi:hypothetical protein
MEQEKPTVDPIDSKEPQPVIEKLKTTTIRVPANVEDIATQPGVSYDEKAHFTLGKNRFYTAIHSFNNPLEPIEGKNMLHLLISNENTLNMFGTGCFYSKSPASGLPMVSHPCQIFKSRNVLYQALVIERESKFTNYHTKTPQPTPDSSETLKPEQEAELAMDIEKTEPQNSVQDPAIRRFHLDILISQRNLPIVFKRFYFHRSVKQGKLNGKDVLKVKFQVSKIAQLYSFKYVNKDIEKFISPLSMSSVFGNENKVLCAGKRHIVELSLETGKVKDVSIHLR